MQLSSTVSTVLTRPGNSVVTSSSVMTSKRKPQEARYPTSLEEWAEQNTAATAAMVERLGELPENEPGVWVMLLVNRKTLPLPWVAWGRFVLRRGRPVLREVHVKADPRMGAPWDIDPRGLTASHLRAISTKATRNDLLAASVFAKAGLTVDPNALEARAKSRYARLSDDDVGRWALDYLGARSAPEGIWRHLLGVWSEQEGWVTEGTVRDRIRLCRSRGYLTPASGPGDRTPAEETDKLRKWIRAKQLKSGKKGKP